MFFCGVEDMGYTDILQVSYIFDGLAIGQANTTTDLKTTSNH
jgi:hypothetical protein